MKKDMKFEDAISALEEKVKILENGNSSLDESLKAFEEAIGLVKLCNGKLEDAEARVRILTESDDGSVTDEPFNKVDET